MKAKEAPFIKLLQTRAQFVIPIYQRTYSWTVAQCQQLWDDILRASGPEADGGHFIGSIVYIEDPGPVTNVDRLLVIDGQQRLTTLTLLLLALRNRIQEVGDESELKMKTIINDYYLFNPAEDGPERYKLSLTQTDKETLFSLVDQASLPTETSRRMIENLAFFQEQLRTSEIGAGSLHAGICRLMVVDVALDPHNDNPQLIFESLNSTGLALTQADLVRNYILMGLPTAEQESLYLKHWRKMEENFGQTNYTEHFDSFMRHYLTLKLGRIPRISEVYAEFKDYARRSQRPIAELVADIHRYSRYYVNIALEREPDQNLRNAIRDINTLKVDTAFPLILEVYDDYAHGKASRADFLGILRLIEGYVLRRAICGIPTNSLNKTFLTFSRQLDKSRYLDSARAAFQLLDIYRRFPNDEEFRGEFAKKDIYNLTARRNYILRKIENYGRKEQLLNIESFTIEHILPQSEHLSAQWRESLGTDWRQIRDTYLHTIGNLTLTGYNSELSDRPFTDKRDMPGGFRESPIGLNKDLATLESWTEDEIKKRGVRLAELAVKLWPAPGLGEEQLDQYRGPSEGEVSQELPDARPEIRSLSDELRKRVLNLDNLVSEQVSDSRISFLTLDTFAEILSVEQGLRIIVKADLDELVDPLHWCTDVRDIADRRDGFSSFILSKDRTDIDYAMDLIRQAYREQVAYDDMVTSP